jgi:acetyl-CoA synthetase
MNISRTLRPYATGEFSWSVPTFFNIAQDVCTKWADRSGRIALIEEDPAGNIHRFTFDELESMSNQLANALAEFGLQASDRVAILLPQTVETALAHLATYKSGATAVPLFSLFGPDSLRYRLSDSGARVLITDSVGLSKVVDLRAELPALKVILCIDKISAGEEANSFWSAVQAQSTTYSSVVTRADDAALLIYTSGTTGKPKGALHAHRVLLGHLPGVELSHNGLPHVSDLFWTPADWAWIGGLLDVLLPAWHHGIPVLAHRLRKFDASAALDLMERHGVRNVFMPPTALKQLREGWPGEFPVKFELRSIASGGESLGEELVAWTRKVFGVEVNEFYGQTECNMVVSSCSPLYPRSNGAIGKPVPGHRVAVVSETGERLPPGQTGNIAIERPDPVMFLRYWNQPEATAEKFAGEFLLTGDAGFEDADGYIHFVGRTDDLITSAGYRIGPGPIEDCLLTHPAVAIAAVVGVPDPIRTERVVAFVVLRSDFSASDALALELQDLVRHRLAAHEYPREIQFVDALPTTATGKIIRRELKLKAMKR